MRRLAIGLLPVVLVVLATSGCGAAARPAPVATAQPRVSGAGGSPLPSPSVAARALPTPAGDSSALVAQAVADAAARSGVAPDAVRVVRVEPREWPDSGLGCPKPGTGYAQVITSGYLIVVEAGGQTLDYHTDRSRVELCQR